MILNAQNNLKTASPISLNTTFFILASGAVTIKELIAQQRATRAHIVATEDDYMRRRRQQAEGADPFGVTYYL